MYYNPPTPKTDSLKFHPHQPGRGAAWRFSQAGEGIVKKSSEDELEVKYTGRMPSQTMSLIALS